MFKFNLLVEDTETDDIICQVEAGSLESFIEQLRKVEQAVAKTEANKKEYLLANV